MDNRLDHDQQSFVEAWRSELRRGLLHLREGAYDQALACLERAHRLASDRAETSYALGRERLRRGQAGAAEPLLRAAWQRDPSLVSAAGTLARCLGVHLGRFDEAHAVLDSAEAEHGPLGLLHVIRSELMLEQDRVAEARAQAEAALACTDSNTVRDAANAALARVCNRQGVDLAERGDYEVALFWFRRAANLDPEWAGPHTNLGAAFMRLGKPELARRAYEHAVAIEPDSAAAHYNMGALLRHTGELAGARAAFERALDSEPMLATAIIALTELDLDDDDPAAAIARLTEALERQPDHADLWAHLGQALAAAGERDDAEACWRRTVDIDPAHPLACRGLADLLARESRFVEAALLAQRAKDARPRSSTPRPARPRTDEQS
jgi:tetratricopeptide (TPR) repeat protein